MATVLKGYNSGTSAWEAVAVGADITNTLTTKGDLLGRSSSAAARLGVGANGAVLTADSAETTGLKWATPVTGSLTLLSTTTLSGSTTTISSINQTYTNLFVTVERINVSSNSELRFYPNNDSSNNSRIVVSGFTGSSAAMAGTASSYVLLSGDSRSILSGNTDNFFVINIPDYSSTNHIKITEYYGGFRGNASADVTAFGSSGLHGTSAEITSLVFATSTGTFSGGTVKVYGVK
jgi:hypothetical protein